jgi:uncharacterized membrane protein
MTKRTDVHGPQAESDKGATVTRLPRPGKAVVCERCLDGELLEQQATKISQLAMALEARQAQAQLEIERLRAENERLAARVGPSAQTETPAPDEAHDGVTERSCVRLWFESGAKKPIVRSVDYQVIGDPMTVTTTIPGYMLRRSLRLSPGTQAGLYVLREVVLHAVSAPETALWRRQGAQLRASLTACDAALLLPRRAAVLLLSYGTLPAVRIRFEGLDSIPPAALLTLRFEYIHLPFSARRLERVATFARYAKRAAKIALRIVGR